MRRNKIALFLAVVMLAAASLACKTVTSVFATPTPQPTATPIPPTATHTPLPTPTATPGAQFNSAGVRLCYYVPGVSQVAQMPAEVLATPTPFEMPAFTPPPNSSVDTSVTNQQLGVYRDLWKAVNDNYVYTDFNGKNWKEIGDRYETLIKKGLTDDDFYIAMSQMIFELGDEHSGYMSPKQVEEDEQQLSGQQNFVGIGAMVMSFGNIEEGVITSVFPGSPAEKAGLRAHDKLVAVDGGPLRDENGLSRTLGPEGTEVTVTMVRPGEEPREVTMTRAAISGPLPIDYCIVPTTRIGYVFLPSFYDETIDEQFREALQKMTSDGPLDGLVIDNRMNGGGINTVVEPILGFFTSGTNGYYVSRTDREPFRIRPEDINGSQDLPLAILVDVDTVSFGEIFSGVLRTSGRAVIIGQNTLGNVEVLRAFSFDDGSRAWVAIANFEPVGEASGIWERTGIIPDYIVPTRWDLFTEATDPALAKAVEVLLGNK